MISALLLLLLSATLFHIMLTERRHTCHIEFQTPYYMPDILYQRCWRYSRCNCPSRTNQLTTSMLPLRHAIMTPSDTLIMPLLFSLLLRHYFDSDIVDC